MLPLTQKAEIEQQEYLANIQTMSQIKLKRYDTYAKVQALAVAFRGDDRGKDIEQALFNYAVRVNLASTAIDKWLTGLYCTPVKRRSSPCSSFNLAFDPYREYQQIQQMVVDIGNRDTEGVATLMVGAISRF